MGMSVSELRNEVEAVNYEEVTERIQTILEDDYPQLIQQLADEHGGTLEDQIVEIFTEMVEHKVECLTPQETGLF